MATSTPISDRRAVASRSPALLGYQPQLDGTRAAEVLQPSAPVLYRGGFTVMALAAASYRLVERPALRLKRRLGRRLGRPASSGA